VACAESGPRCTASGAYNEGDGAQRRPATETCATASWSTPWMVMPTNTTEAPNLRDVLHAPLMRAEDVADLLAIKVSTVYELSRRRHDPLPFVRIGRSKRFDRRALARWVEANASR
jgi:excisionase family DNA binding protein